MAKRKGRLVTSREQNGRIQRERERSPAQIKRVLDQACADARHQEWGTPLGRLLLAGRITEQQYAAGLRWADYAAKYSQAMQSPSPDPRSIQIGEGRGGHHIDPDSADGRAEARRHARAIKSFVNAGAALSCNGDLAVRVVRGVCERGNNLEGHQQFLALRSGLSTLASFWGLTSSDKSVSVR